MRQEKIDTANPRLGRPLTWAEEVLLKTARTGIINIHIVPSGWPKWLIRYVVKPLIRNGIILPFSNNEYFQLSSEGKRLAWSL